MIRSLKPVLIDSISLLNKKDKAMLPLFGLSVNNNNIKTNKGKKVWLESYGCSASMADGEIISGLLRDQGYILSANEYDADLNLIVTCSVKDVTEHRMIHRIKHLSKLKKPLIVGGCLPQADKRLIEKINASASMIGPNSINQIADVVDCSFEGKKKEILSSTKYEKLNFPKIRKNPLIGIVQISSGCLSECSFCQTKLAKGNLKSYRIGSILEQIEKDLKDGCKEIWLTSTDNGCYGRDIGSTLPELIEKCSKFGYDYKIRIGMMNPMYIPDMIDRLIEIMSKNDKVFKFLHIPVQSGSSDVLRDMKRPNSDIIFRKIIKRIRNNDPKFSIATDIIVGYPTETDKDFDDSLKLLEETKPDFINVSRFSLRPGTSAYKYKTLQSNVIKSRIKRLNNITSKIFYERNNIWLGVKEDVIINEVYKRYSQARTHAYKPVVIQEDIQNITNTLGKKIRIEINNFSKLALRGKLIT